MRIPAVLRFIVIGSLVAVLAGGCSRTEITAPRDSDPQRIEPIDGLDFFEDPIILPSQDWVVVAEPEVLEDIADLEIEVIGYDDFDDTVVALIDSEGGVTQQELLAAGAMAVIPNFAVRIVVDSGSLVIGFVDGEFEVGGTTAWVNLRLPEVHPHTTGVGVRIGVVDTGAAFDHPLLVNNVVLMQSSRMAQTEEEPNGVNDDPEFDDHIDEGWGHGTFVSGEVVITAPGAEFLPIRALNHEGNGSVVDVISAMYLCRKYECDVINLSLSFSDYHGEFEKILNQFLNEGILVVASAGNAGHDLPLFPASSPYCVGVAAINEHYRFPPFTAMGPLVDVAAPGWRVTSIAITSPTQRAYASGTSMAAPIVCGASALLMEKFGLTALGAFAHLRANPHVTWPQDGVLYGAVDPFAAIHVAPQGGI